MYTYSSRFLYFQLCVLSFFLDTLPPAYKFSPAYFLKYQGGMQLQGALAHGSADVRVEITMPHVPPPRHHRRHLFQKCDHLPYPELVRGPI